MEVLLSRVTQQAVHYAIRSGISITTGYALKECGKLLKQAPRGKERDDLRMLQSRLESKIRVIAPSIDMIELIAARGNTSLESALSLTKDLRLEIQRVGNHLERAAEQEKSSKGQAREDKDRNLRNLVQELKLLLARIEDAVPLINLAITTSGVNLSTKLSGTISPSRLLQASTFLTSADSRFTNVPTSRQTVGPTYTLKLYMLFAGHANRPVDEDGIRQTTWKEVIHKARVKLWRVPLEELYALPGEDPQPGSETARHTIPADGKASEFAYQLVLVEDHDDEMVHDPEDSSQFDDVEEAGIRDVVPVHEISKIFYADTGKILGIGSDGETYSPVLLLKRDVHAEPPRRMLQRAQSHISLREDEIASGSPDGKKRACDDQSEIDAQFERESAPPTPVKQALSEAAADSAWRLPADLDPEWLAFEVFTDDQPNSQSDGESIDETERPSTGDSTEADLENALSGLKLRSSLSPSPALGQALIPPPQPLALQFSPSKRAGPPIKTSLSLLEMLLKLAALQQFRQESHLAIEDELLNFFLEDSATAGAGADKDYRRRVRHDATKRVGFDPYDESPVKRRGEEYIRNASPRGSPVPEQAKYNEAYEYGGRDPFPRLDFARPSIELPSPIGNGSASSSPPSRPPLHQQIPSHSSTPNTRSNSHRSSIGGKDFPKLVSPHSLTTPPSTAKMRAETLRAQSGSKPNSRSPLHEVTNDEC